MLHLQTRERSFAVAAVRALGARAVALCARRSPALQRHAEQLVADPELLARTAAQLDRSVPHGVAEVHPSWYQAPPASARPEAAAWLERRAYSHLVDMTSGRSGQARSAALELESRDAATLAELLHALGRQRVATAFSGAPRSALAQLCARLGEPSASELVAQVRALSTNVSSDEARAAQRAVFQLVTLGPDAEHDLARALFLRAGSSWLGPALAARGGDALRRIAQRLPRPEGEALLAAGRTPASDADSAAALAQATQLLATARLRAL